MSENKTYTYDELKAKLTEKEISDQFSEDRINFDSKEANYVDDYFTSVFESFLKAIEKAYK